MNIVYCTDNNYCVYMKISMISLLENNKREENIVLYVLTMNLNEVNRKDIQETVKKYKREIHIIDVDSNLLRGIKSTIPLSAFLRLFLNKFIKCEKCLYLDCDTIVCGSLAELWELDIEEYYFGAVIDTVEIHYRRAIGLDKADIYTNSGIMLINCKKWEVDNVGILFEEYIVKHNYAVPHNDQGVLNGTLGHKIKVLPLKYNVMPSMFEFTWIQNKRMANLKYYYSEKEFAEAKENPVIIHFCAGYYRRPWEIGCRHPLRKVFYHYSNEIENFRMVPVKRESRTLKFYRWIYYHMPYVVYFVLMKIRQYILRIRFMFK